MTKIPINYIIVLMNIDLLSIINNAGTKIGFEGEVVFADNEVTVNSNVTGQVLNFAGRLEVSGIINATVKTLCARCLAPLYIPLSFEIEETVGEDEVILDGTILDIDDIVNKNILVNMSIKYLCSEDCKGICSNCGTDLNLSECTCEEEVIDERFAALKNLLNKQQDREVD